MDVPSHTNSKSGQGDFDENDFFDAADKAVIGCFLLSGKLHIYSIVVVAYFRSVWYCPPGSDHYIWDSPCRIVESPWLSRSPNSSRAGSQIRKESGNGIPFGKIGILRGRKFRDVGKNKTRKAEYLPKEEIPVENNKTRRVEYFPKREILSPDLNGTGRHRLPKSSDPDGNF